MLSLVIPVFNESKLIDELMRRTMSALNSITRDFEIIMVDDGSTDNSLDILLGWQKNDQRIKILSLSRNFGHQAAFTAGLEHAMGDVVAMLDGDLQDPPELLGEMYDMITNQGYDVVSGRKSGRKGRIGRNFSAMIFHLIFRHIGEIKNMENYGNYSMMNRQALTALLALKEKVRYLPGLRTIIGFRQGYVEFVRDERFSGYPKMSVRKLAILAADAVFSFSRFPIRVCLVLGFIGTLIFMAAGIYVLIAKMKGFAVPGWSSTLLSIYFLGSIQLVFLGIMGEYIYRSYKESQDRPVYFVRKFYEAARKEQ